ncbi:1729_t:CDS:2, partial [Gigaspora rosea]
MEYKLVGAASEVEEMEDKDEPVESVPLEGEFVEYEPVETSQSSRNFEDVDKSNTPVELFVGQRFDSWPLAEHCNHMVNKRTYVCENARKYKPNKTKPLEHQCLRGSKKTNCKWHVNLSNSKINNYVNITFIDLEHNHIINVDNARFDLFNAIQKIKRKKQVVGSDASHLLKLLLQQQKENPIMFVQSLINANSNCLS